MANPREEKEGAMGAIARPPPKRARKIFLNVSEKNAATVS